MHLILVPRVNDLENIRKELLVISYCHPRIYVEELTRTMVITANLWGYHWW